MFAVADKILWAQDESFLKISISATKTAVVVSDQRLSSST